MDLGKFKYEQSKKNKKTTKIELKTIQFKANIDENDLRIKFNNFSKYFDAGHKIKVVMKLSGRENAKLEFYKSKFDKLIQNLSANYNILSNTTVEQNKITAMFGKN